jgi:hypothetical protein
MLKFIIALLTASTVAIAAGRLQNADFATLAQITGAGGTSAQLLNTSKIYDSTNAQLLDTTIAAKLNSSAFTDAAVTSKLLTGYVSGAGTVAATDTILQAIQKLNGNIGAISSGITELTGDVTAGPGSGSQAATIANNAVSDAKFRQSAGLSVVGRSTNSTGNVADITAANDGEVLRRSGTSVGFGTVATAGIANNAVTAAKANADFVQGQTTVTAVGADYVLIADTSDSGNVKKALVSDISGGGGGTITDWTEITSPNITVPCSVGTQTKIFVREVGDTLYVKGSFRCTTTVSAITAQIDLVGYTFDYTKITNIGSARSHAGNFQAQTGGTQNINQSTQGGTLYFDGSDTNTVYFATQVSGNDYVTITNMSTILGTNEVMQFEFSAPIL